MEMRRHRALSQSGKLSKMANCKNDSILLCCICFFTPETCESTPPRLLVRFALARCLAFAAPPSIQLHADEVIE
jgi:hypothetical protein